MSRAVGIDLGGTNLRAALFADLEAGIEPAARVHQEVGPDRSPDALADRIAALVRSFGHQAGSTSVGVGVAAMLRGDEGLVANSPHLGWREVPFGELLRDRLGAGTPIAIHNDVDAITYGEYRRGAGEGASELLAVFAGTGIGAGIIAGGRLIRGARGCAAEIGHVKVAAGDDAVLCNCGQRGCLEAYAGGAYLMRRARAELAGGARSMAVRLAGDPSLVHPGHLDQAAAEGDEYALELFAEVAPLLGLALANAVTLLNPERLILGGGVLSRTPVFRQHVIASMEIATNPPALEQLAICDPALGDDAGLVGSALLALERS